ncbi:MAG TPA: glycosyltransferase [Polyangiaceae bacterium]|nr:glycosyltransferase [Polyangiaceae bacterium]
MSETTLVVPCYNEEARLDPARFRALLDMSGFALMFVDDGSTDATPEILAGLRRNDRRASVLRLHANVGKGEAVRLGMVDALARGARVVGYADADLSTPPEELVRLHGALLASDAAAVTGARVALMGREIVRRHWRHYTGRVFATFASMVLRAPYYDTQCGAKFFRRSALLERALRGSFASRWAFDVELLGRILSEAQCIEVPLMRWEHSDGSKLGMASMLRATAELAIIESRLRRWRR